MARRISALKPSTVPKLDALEVRETDALIAKLLADVQLSLLTSNRTLFNKIAELKTVLAADYRQAPGMPSSKLLTELARIVDRDLRPRFSTLSPNWDNKVLLAQLAADYGPRRIEVRADQYRKGSGLSLRGFFCRTEIDNHPKFLIFLNTAHHPAAVASTFGHELGHYIYGSLVRETADFNAFVEGGFGAHLRDENELFADSLVALSAYDQELMKRIAPPGQNLRGDGFLNWVRELFNLFDRRYHFDVRGARITDINRLGYIAAMIHFFKLRRALYEHSGV